MQSKAFVRRAVVFGSLLLGMGSRGFGPTTAHALQDDPGAIVEVTLEGRVGVVLDEIPLGSRPLASLYYLTRPRQFWRDRAMLQLQHTSYQLTYRNFFYPEEENKGIMALPPRSLWQIELDDLIPLRVRTADGHDAMVMRYTLRTTLLSDADTPALAEPALAEIGALGGVTACMYREALASAIIGNVNTAVSFTCPAARGPSEPGGSFGYYRSPVLPTQAGAPIQCVRVP